MLSLLNTFRVCNDSCKYHYMGLMSDIKITDLQCSAQHCLRNRYLGNFQSKQSEWIRGFTSCDIENNARSINLDPKTLNHLAYSHGTISDIYTHVYKIHEHAEGLYDWMDEYKIATQWAFSLRGYRFVCMICCGEFTFTTKIIATHVLHVDTLCSSVE